MVRHWALVGSLVVHSAIGLAVLALVDRSAGQPVPTAVAIELVAASAPRPSSPAPRPAAGPRQRARRAATARAAATADATVRIEPAGDAAGADGAGAAGAAAGDGAGATAGGDGAGRGLGQLGTAAMPAAAPLPAPEPPAEPVRISRARPPKLIYPSRNRDADADQLCVAQLTIDADGFVVGAHLVRGRGGRRDDRAADAVWRFRYLPALDDDGRPIAATIEQPFLVE